MGFLLRVDALLRRIVLRGRGSESRGRGCAADLVLVVHEALHPRFERRGDDLYTRVDVPLLQVGRRRPCTVQRACTPNRVPGARLHLPARERLLFAALCMSERNPALGVGL